MNKAVSNRDFFQAVLLLRQLGHFLTKFCVAWHILPSLIISGLRVAYLELLGAAAVVLKGEDDRVVRAHERAVPNSVDDLLQNKVQIGM